MQDHPHISLTTVVELLAVTRQRCDQIMQKMQREGCVVKGSADGGKLGWRLPWYDGPPVHRVVAENPDRARAMELVREQGFVRSCQAPKGLLKQMEHEGLLESPLKGIYVLPGTVPRMGILIRGDSMAGHLRKCILRNVELHGQTGHMAVVVENHSDNINVGSACVRLRELGVIEHHIRNKTRFTALGLRMLAEERKHNPPGVFTPLGAIDDL
jgi:hypothetical protein